MAYRIELTRAASRDLKALPRNVLRRVDRHILDLEKDPRPRSVEKLSGGQGLYRIRVGTYRVLYRIEDNVLLIVVVRVGHRRDVYRQRS